MNVLAVQPRFRNLGLGTQLLGGADEIRRARARRGKSIIVSDSNPIAQRLYERCGDRVAATRPRVKEGWQNPGRDWVVLTKAF